VLLIHLGLLSPHQPALDVFDDETLFPNLRLDGLDMLLYRGVGEQQDVSAGMVEVVVPVELVVITVEEDVSGCDKVEFAGIARVGDEECPFPRWMGSFGTNRRPRTVE
jgi:hypothetical protein